MEPHPSLKHNLLSHHQLAIKLQPAGIQHAEVEEEGGEQGQGTVAEDSKPPELRRKKSKKNTRRSLKLKNPNASTSEILQRTDSIIEPGLSLLGRLVQVMSRQILTGRVHCRLQ